MPGSPLQGDDTELLALLANESDFGRVDLTVDPQLHDRVRWFNSPTMN
jgi:hypothetical protein